MNVALEVSTQRKKQWRNNGGEGHVPPPFTPWAPIAPPPHLTLDYAQ